MANFNGNLRQLISECKTILDFAAADDEGGTGTMAVVIT